MSNPLEEFNAKAAEERQQKYQEYFDADLAEQASAREWEPLVAVITGKVGPFICFEGHDFPAAYIEAIKCINPGSAPLGLGADSHTAWRLSPQEMRNVDSKWHAIPASPATIRITMFSGRTIDINISRHKVDILLAELIKLWREYR